MKKLFLFFVFILTANIGFARKSFIPHYSSFIAIEDSGIISSDSTIDNELFCAPMDRRFSIAILHDTITKERIKSIKMQTAAYGLAITAAVLGAASSVAVAHVALTPLNAYWHGLAFGGGLAIAGSSTYLAIASKRTIDELHKLPITILFTNNTDREMCVNDMNRGHLWYVRPYCELSLTTGNPEVNSFRVAFADCSDSRPCYITTQGANVLEDVNMVYENDNYWVFDNVPADDKTEPLGLYVIEDKHTRERKLVKESSCNAFVINQKSKMEIR